LWARAGNQLKLKFLWTLLNRGIAGIREIFTEGFVTKTATEIVAELTSRCFNHHYSDFAELATEATSYWVQVEVRAMLKQKQGLLNLQLSRATMRQAGQPQRGGIPLVP
jgi:hypothetical protein